MIATERRKVQWTTEEDAELKRIYAISNPGQAARAMTKLAQTKSVRIGHLRSRAHTLGLSRVDRHHRPWTQAEDENLRAYAGRLPVFRIAKILGRTRESVTVRINRLEMSQRVRERGYTKTELADLLGVDLQRTLNAMLERWPLEKNVLGNYAKDEVSLWVYEHMDQIEFRKCDQFWLKEMLKGAA